MPIPPFEQGTGNLPPGVHLVTWDEIRQRYGRTQRRRLLLAGLRAGLEALKSAGCQRAYINGSFVTRESKPHDFDALWEFAGVDLARLDSVLLDIDPPRQGQKRKYRGEFMPVDSSGGPLGTALLDFFQKDRAGHAKGIIAVNLGALR